MSKIPDTTTALKNGISMIHQELKSNTFSKMLLINIWVGRFITKGLIVDENQDENKKLKKLLNDLDFNISAQTLAKDLSVSQLQAIEIAKANFV